MNSLHLQLLLRSSLPLFTAAKYSFQLVCFLAELSKGTLKEVVVMFSQYDAQN